MVSPPAFVTPFGNNVLFNLVWNEGGLDLTDGLLYCSTFNAHGHEWTPLWEVLRLHVVSFDLVAANDICEPKNKL